MYLHIADAEPKSQCPDSVTADDLKEKLTALDPVALFRSVVKNKAECPVMGLVADSPGHKTQHLAKQLLMTEWTSEMAQFSKELVCFVSGSLVKRLTKQFTSASMLEMLEDLTSDMQKESLQSSWSLAVESMLKPQSPRYLNNLLQHCIRELVPTIIQHVATPMCSPLSSAPALEKGEKEVLYYAAGYIPRKLRNKFGRQTGNRAAQLLREVVTSWIISSNYEEKNLPEDLKGWIKTQDRGGLLHVNGDFYYLIC